MANQIGIFILDDFEQQMFKGPGFPLAGHKKSLTFRFLTLVLQQADMQVDLDTPMAYPRFLEGTPLANGPITPAKDVVGTTAALDTFTRRILQVPYSAIKAKLEAEKRTPKRSASRASASSPKRAT